MTNPYQAPPDSTPQQPLAGRLSKIGIEFESDWSPQGLRQRRKHAWHRILDIGFAACSLFWIGSLVMSAGSPYAGIFCVLTPMWLLFSIIWFTNFNFRNGESFRKKYPGLSGPVRGRVDGQSIVVHGPMVSLATRLGNCLQCYVSPSKATFQPPGFESTLPVAASDILRDWLVERPSVRVTQQQLLDELFPDSVGIRVEGTIRGHDLKALPRWRLWFWSGWTLIAMGGSALAWSLFLIRSLPSWILDPPGHYRLGDQDYARLTGPAVLGCVGIGLLVAGLWQWSRTWRKVGDFAVSIHPDHIAVANQAITLAYHDQALAHFRWTEVGLVARGRDRRAMFAIPARWFSNEEKQSLQSWYGRAADPPTPSYYLGPNL